MCESSLSTVIPLTGSLVLLEMRVETVRKNYKLELEKKLNKTKQTTSYESAFNWKM